MEFKRLCIVGSAILGLLLVSLSINLGFEYLVGHNKWIGLVVGIFFMVLGGISLSYGKKHFFFNVLSFVLNMLGVGFSITAYYVFKAYALSLYDFGFAISVSLAMLGGFGLLTFIPFMKRHLKWSIAVVIIVSFVSSLILWLTVEGFTGLSFYFLNIIYFFMVAMIKSTDSIHDLAEEMALVSLGSFVLVSIIVLIIFTEGEVLSSTELPIPQSKKVKSSID